MNLIYCKHYRKKDHYYVSNKKKFLRQIQIRISDWRWFVYLWCDSKTCRSCKRKLNMFFWKVMARTMAFLLPRHPHIGNYLHSPHSFSVHLLNCYFPDFPACHIAEKFRKCSCFLNPANTTDERVNFHSTM